MKLTIEKISEKYLKDAHKIYNYYIINSYSNFEEKKLTFNEFHNNFLQIYTNIVYTRIIIDFSFHLD